MSKKRKKIKIRRAWQINPKTRIKRSKKRYSRKNKKKVIEHETPLEIYGGLY